MSTVELLDIIKNSFEEWYNETICSSPVSIVINYKDTQTLSIKAIHTVTLEMCAIGIKDNLSFVHPLLKLQDNYNHGLVSEEEALQLQIHKLLMKMYGWRK